MVSVMKSQKNQIKTDTQSILLTTISFAYAEVVGLVKSSSCNTCVTRCSKRNFEGFTSFNLYSTFPAWGSGGNWLSSPGSNNPKNESILYKLQCGHKKLQTHLSCNVTLLHRVWHACPCVCACTRVRAHTQAPVSYTHLDVYKRQIQYIHLHNLNKHNLNEAIIYLIMNVNQLPCFKIIINKLYFTRFYSFTLLHLCLSISQFIFTKESVK